MSMTTINRFIAATLFLLSGFLLSTSAAASTHTADDFVTQWQMPADDLTLTFPGTGNNYSINWGDGTATQNTSTAIDHPYAAVGTRWHNVYCIFKLLSTTPTPPLAPTKSQSPTPSPALT